jgi:hypothetical protein
VPTASAAVSEVIDGSHCDEAPRSDVAARASEELLNEVNAFLSSDSSNKVRSVRFVAICFWTGVPSSDFSDESKGCRCTNSVAFL